MVNDCLCSKCCSLRCDRNRSGVAKPKRKNGPALTKKQRRPADATATKNNDQQPRQQRCKPEWHVNLEAGVKPNRCCVCAFTNLYPFILCKSTNLKITRKHMQIVTRFFSAKLQISRGNPDSRNEYRTRQSSRCSTTWSHGSALQGSNLTPA